MILDWALLRIQPLGGLNLKGVRGMVLHSDFLMD